MPGYEGLTRGQIKRMEDGDLVRYAAKLVHDQAIARGDQGLLAVLADEWALSSLGNPTIFIENEELVEMLYHSNFSINMDSFALPHGKNLAYYSFPRHTVVDDHNLPGCYFGRIDRAEWENATAELLEISGSNTRIRLVEKSDGSSFYLAYNSPNGLCGLHFTPDEVEDSLNGGIDFSVAVEERADLLTDESKSWGNTLLRLCAAVSVYVRAFPQAYRSGLPEGMEGKTSSVRSLLTKPMKVGVYSSKHKRVLKRAEVKRAFGNSRSKRIAHWRQGHFRTLSHEKYQRNPDGSERVIFIQGSVVNKDIDPSTVEMLDVDAIREGADNFLS